MPVTDRAPAVTKLPPVTLPVATTNPAVPRLPTLALPVTLNVPVNTPDVAPMLPTLALPVALNVPKTLAPVPVTTKTLAFPPTDKFTLPLTAGILTFETPLARTPKTLPLRLPMNVGPITLPVDITCPLVSILPPVIFPATQAYPVKLIFDILAMLAGKSTTRTCDEE